MQPCVCLFLSPGSIHLLARNLQCRGLRAASLAARRVQSFRSHLSPDVLFFCDVVRLLALLAARFHACCPQLRDLDLPVAYLCCGAGFLLLTFGAVSTSVATTSVCSGADPADSVSFDLGVGSVSLDPHWFVVGATNFLPWGLFAASSSVW